MATVVLVRSVVDVVGLCVLLPEAMRSLVTAEDTATASALDGLVTYGRTLAEAAVEQLRRADPTWGPVAAHVLEQAPCPNCSRPYLAYISPRSRLHLAQISPRSRPYLTHDSPRAGGAGP